MLNWAIRLASAWNICFTWLVTTSASITLTATWRRGMFCSYRNTSANPPEPSTLTYEKPGRFGGCEGKRRAKQLLLSSAGRDRSGEGVSQL